MTTMTQIRSLSVKMSLEKSNSNDNYNTNNPNWSDWLCRGCTPAFSSFYSDMTDTLCRCAFRIMSWSEDSMYYCTYGLLCSAIFIVHLETAVLRSSHRPRWGGAEEGNLQVLKQCGTVKPGPQLVQSSVTDTPRGRMISCDGSTNTWQMLRNQYGPRYLSRFFPAQV